MKIEKTSLDEFDAIRQSTSVYIDVYKAVINEPIGGVLKITVGNKSLANKIQSALQSNGTHQSSVLAGVKVSTRTKPANGDKDGEWVLLIKRLA